jgi:5-methylcytosine-specific restriction endonuclease McrA
MSLLQKDIVLEVNRNYMATGWRTVGEAMVLLCKDAVRVLPVTIQVDGSPLFDEPKTWEQWLRVPIRKPNRVIHTASQLVAIPEVVIDRENAYVPHEVLPLDLRGIYVRDKGIDQYTGKQITMEEASMDHIQPKSRGGDSSWLNLVLASRETNQFKADRTPAEAGLRLIRAPRIPAPMPVYATLSNRHNIPECASFLRF